MITLVHCDTESLATLEGALERMGYRSCRAGHPDQAAPAGPVILMGAGPLDPAAAQLKATGWWRELPQLAADGRRCWGSTSACTSWPKAARNRPGARAWA